MQVQCKITFQGSEVKGQLTQVASKLQSHSSQQTHTHSELTLYEVPEVVAKMILTLLLLYHFLSIKSCICIDLCISFPTYGNTAAQFCSLCIIHYKQILSAETRTKIRTSFLNTSNIYTPSIMKGNYRVSRSSPTASQCFHIRRWNSFDPLLTF